MTMIYEQATGKFYINGERVETGYAGAPGHINNAASECIPFKGPLPRGFYRMTHEKKNVTVDDIRLTPLSPTQMCGRDGMLIHGGKRDGSLTASEGCIILSHPTRLKIIREIGQGNDKLEVR